MGNAKAARYFDPVGYYTGLRKVTGQEYLDKKVGLFQDNPARPLLKDTSITEGPAEAERKRRRAGTARSTILSSSSGRSSGTSPILGGS